MRLVSILRACMHSNQLHIPFAVQSKEVFLGAPAGRRESNRHGVTGPGRAGKQTSGTKQQRLNKQLSLQTLG
jgi:hypothetical protein